jgi:hypothetical protein
MPFFSSSISYGYDNGPGLRYRFHQTTPHRMDCHRPEIGSAAPRGWLHGKVSSICLVTAATTHAQLNGGWPHSPFSRPKNPCRNELSRKRRTCVSIDGEPTSRKLSQRTPVPLVSLWFFSFRSPRLATAMACSYDRARRSVPADGSDCGTLCRTASLRVTLLFRLGRCRRWWRLRGRCLRGWCRLR